jgi:hypothetical protein
MMSKLPDLGQNGRRGVMLALTHDEADALVEHLDDYLYGRTGMRCRVGPRGPKAPDDGREPPDGR